MSNLTKSMEAQLGDRDTVVEKLLTIFPAMDREVARYRVFHLVLVVFFVVVARVVFVRFVLSAE
jgi:hypothetical protein